MKTIDHIHISAETDGGLAQLYRSLGCSYPKFFKMDVLSRLGFVVTEMLLSRQAEERFVERDDRAVVFVGRNGSLATDTHYQATLAPDNYFPSPALFVYTLPNIVTGEVSIRNKYYGETCFYALPERDDAEVQRLLSLTLLDNAQVLGGWLDAVADDCYEADIYLLSND